MTEEAAITAGPAEDLRVEVLVSEGDHVAQGAPVMRSRRLEGVTFTAPMPARVARIELAPGHRLSMMQFFREPGAGRHRHDAAAAGNDDAALRRLLGAAGLWRRFRARPFGRVPPPDQTPAAIFVTGQDTRPNAPHPRVALRGREEALAAGVAALLRLTLGPVFLCQDDGPPLLADPPERVRVIGGPAVHPWGLAGLNIHRSFPATPERPVWEIHAEDAADIGTLLATGLVPETRLITVTGAALTAPRLVRCQPGADLRGLVYAHLRPGPHRLVSGSAVDGREARWLRARDRQAVALEAAPARRERHWFVSALTRAARPLPLVPTAAIDRAMGGALPAMAFLRALSAGDAETFERLGGLSFVGEDLSLADYVTGAEPPLSARLEAMLDRIRVERAA